MLRAAQHEPGAGPYGPALPVESNGVLICAAKACKTA